MNPKAEKRIIEGPRWNCYLGRAALVALLGSCWTNSVAAGEKKRQSVIADKFANPEDLADIAGTPWVMVSEFAGDASRDIKGSLSLYNTRNQKRVAFSALKAVKVNKNNNNKNLKAKKKPARSPLADPTCEPRALDSLSPHGIEAYNNHDGTWEIAVVNHFAYESIEFFLLDFSDPTSHTRPQLASMGCVRLTSGDVHNNLAYNSDKSALAVSLWFDSYFGTKGQLNVAKIVSKSLVGVNQGDGKVKIITKNGQVKTLADNLLAPNGVRWSRSDRVIFVAESPLTSKSSKILVIDPDTGHVATAFTVDGLPDNFGTVDSTTSASLDEEHETTTDDIFLVTKVAFSQNQLLCSFVQVDSACSDLDFTVIRYNYSKDTTTEIYSSTMNGQATVGMIKEGVLYAGNYNQPDLVKVTGFFD